MSQEIIGSVSTAAQAQRPKRSQFMAIVLFLAIMLLTLSFSIAVPIVCRPFYYAHIDLLNLTETEIPMEVGTRTLTEEEIRRAYDEMLDYCEGRSREFSAGVLRYSQEGKDHFTDCRKLFLLDFAICGFCALLILICLIVQKARKIRPARWKHRPVTFWSGLVLLIAFGVVGGLGSINFDRTFEIFHKIFFPGKTNWVFSADQDPIILLLPEKFFLDCAILIVVLVLLICVALILTGPKKKRPAR